MFTYDDIFKSDMHDLAQGISFMYAHGDEDMREFLKGNIDLLHKNGASPLSFNEIMHHVRTTPMFSLSEYFKNHPEALR